MRSDWRRVELPGRSFQARPGSPVDAAFPERGDVTDVPMSWSLGVLGDLMWMRLPEARPILAEGIADEVENAMDAGRVLILLVGDLVTDLWHRVMEPTLNNFPRTKERVAAQLRVVLEVYRAEHPDQDTTRYMIEQSVFIYLQEPPIGPSWKKSVLSWRPWSPHECGCERRQPLPTPTASSLSDEAEGSTWPLWSTGATEARPRQAAAGRLSARPLFFQQRPTG
ncbi:hypothetical protein [Amycolatopsis sp. FDAARGOS 1241]|uniref:hypothetical protein n=1 Tax=Amycolatopsis sp. FDAARGOS 1241 TaxID=2778070 RepID=UPI00194E2966|nr:hypothetical protein [Amycolatopsis sp. FDAARGOS 1241]QRP42709.1 hypothetical protein I6J71_24795 [Amycolatopsis sp. FDAARGOS 1241]